MILVGCLNFIFPENSLRTSEILNPLTLAEALAAYVVVGGGGEATC